MAVLCLWRRHLGPADRHGGADSGVACRSPRAARPGRAEIARRSPGVCRPRGAHRPLDRLAVGSDRPHVHAGVDRGEQRAQSRARRGRLLSLRGDRIRRSASSRRSRQLAHPKSREWNPIRCLDHMAANDDVAYVPYLFNYVNYSSGSPARPITFGAPPAVAKGLPARTLLGGAGIGVSAKSANPQGRLRLRHVPLLAGLPVGRLRDLWRATGQPHGVAVGRLQRDHRRLLPQHAAGDGPGLSPADPCRASFPSSTTRR